MNGYEENIKRQQAEVQRLENEKHIIAQFFKKFSYRERILVYKSYDVPIADTDHLTHVLEGVLIRALVRKHGLQSFHEILNNKS